MNLKSSLVSGAVAAFGLFGALAANAGDIAPGLASVDVMHNGQKVTVTRTDDKSKSIPAAYQRVARNCPPFCVQPMEVVPGVDTVGELEVVGYLKRIAEGDDSVLVVDSRTSDWVGRGTVPGSINIPWNKINLEVTGTWAIDAEAKGLAKIMEQHFGATQGTGGWDFSNAKTLVLFCNGIWCGQSSVNIKTLAKMGYPLHKLKWYRGGMQDWVSVGLTVVK